MAQDFEGNQSLIRFSIKLQVSDDNDYDYDEDIEGVLLQEAESTIDEYFAERSALHINGVAALEHDPAPDDEEDLS